MIFLKTFSLLLKKEIKMGEKERRKKNLKTDENVIKLFSRQDFFSVFSIVGNLDLVSLVHSFLASS